MSQQDDPQPKDAQEDRLAGPPAARAAQHDEPDPPEAGQQEQVAQTPAGWSQQRVAAAEHKLAQEQGLDFDALSPGQQAAEQTMATVENLPRSDWQADLDRYPLREPGEDPRWAIRIVWTWIGVVLFFIAFIVWLAVAGWACVPR